MFYFGREGRNLCFLGTPNFTHFLASSSYAVSANLRQGVEPVEVNGPLSTECWGSGVSIFSTGKPDGQGQTLVSSIRTCRVTMHFHLGRRLKEQACGNTSGL